MFIVLNGLISVSLYAQQEIKDNGKNLQTVCSPESCSHIVFTSSIFFPFNDETKEWEIRNMEVAIKKNGNFISTGDLYVYGVDTAAILTLELVFLSEDDTELYKYPIPTFEFYNEQGTAEPIIVSGKMDAETAQAVSYIDLDVHASERLPYYEISSDCYHACKEHQLKEAMKAFKKAK